MPISKKQYLITLTMFVLFSNTSHADIYKWVDQNGKTRFSDVKPENAEVDNVELKQSNVIQNREIELDEKNKFQLPVLKSDIPFRFVLTSRMNNKQPADQLDAITITLKQQSFYAYMKLTGVEQEKTYRTRVRILDAKNTVIFDNSINQKTKSSNTIWTATTITPNVSIDAPGDWTFQYIVNNKLLTIEHKKILFQ